MNFESSKCLAEYVASLGGRLYLVGGAVALITPKSFLEDEFSNGKRLGWLEEHFRFLGQYLLPCNAFARVGVERFETKVVVWQRI